ncbi:MAG TPA: hypothetical protein VE869_18410 [Gemmatimonas sp.]|nr:hypothetical protein [Gemmatimonas sp.]
MAVIKWIASGRGGNSAGVALLTTDLNTLANGGGVVSPLIENDTTLDQYADFELVVAHGAATTADTTWDLYLVRMTDGTNYEDATNLRPPANGFVGSFVMDNTASAQRHIVPGVLLPPRAFKVLLINRSGQTAAASGNVLEAYFYNQQVV